MNVEMFTACRKKVKIKLVDCYFLVASALKQVFQNY